MAPAIIRIASLRGTLGRSNEARRNEIIALGARHRGRHDELLREFSAGQGLRFDILMDIGGFRDMHRHRRCIQILQPFTNAHGYEVPEGLADAGLLQQYDSAMTQAHEAFVNVSSGRPGGECGLRFASGHAHPRSVQDGLRAKRCTSLNCALRLPDTSLTAASPGRCTRQWLAGTRRSLQYFRVADINQPIDLLQR